MHLGSRDSSSRNCRSNSCSLFSFKATRGSGDDLVEHAAGASGGLAGAGTGSATQQVVDHGLDEGLLDVLGRGEGEFLDVAAVLLQNDRCVQVEGGVADAALAADDLGAVGSTAVESGKAPAAGSNRG